MELDIIQRQTTWNDAVASLNGNFAKIRQAALSSKWVTYTHSQESVSDTWTIIHNLGRHPSVSVVDSAGTQVYGDVEYDNENQLTITFSAPFSGKAYLN